MDTKTFTDNYISLGGAADQVGLSLTHLSLLRSEGRVTGLIRLPNGIVLANKNTVSLLSRAEVEEQGPATIQDMDYPEGATDRKEWKERHGLTESQVRSVIRMEPERIIWANGNFSLVWDRSPSDHSLKMYAVDPRQLSEAAVARVPELADERWGWIITARRSGMTLNQCAEILKVTRQRVKQLQDKAVRQLLKLTEDNRAGPGKPELIKGEG